MSTGHILGIFKKLSDDELAKYAAWARENYRPGAVVNPLLHPAARMECEKMNLEVIQAREN